MEARGGGELRQLIAQLSDGVLVIDRDGCLVFLNPAAEHLLGRPAAELLGEHVGLPTVAGAPWVEIDLVTSDGSGRVAEMQVAEVEWDGQPAFVASLRDVTERKLKRLEVAYGRARVQCLSTDVKAEGQRRTRRGQFARKLDDFGGARDQISGTDQRTSACRRSPPESQLTRRPVSATDVASTAPSSSRRPPLPSSFA